MPWTCRGLSCERGFFIISSILWGMLVDKKRPDKFEIFGSMVAVLGAAIIF